MTAWYVSSAAYAGIAAFQATHAYIVGDIIKQVAPTDNTRHAFRCTTAGTTAASEPSWNLGNNITTTSGTAVFTCITGQSWASAAGDIGTVTNDGSGGTRALVGDNVFVSSDHSESIAGSKGYLTFMGGAWTGAYNLLCSVSRAGSVPPVAADITSGAAVTVSGDLRFEGSSPSYISGLSGLSGGNILFNNSRAGPVSLKNSALRLNNATSSARINNGNAAKVIWDNVTVQFGHVGQAIGGATTYPLDLTWTNTPSALQGATIPTNLFIGAANAQLLVTCRGVDLSGVTTALLGFSPGGAKVLLDSCRIASGVTRYTGSPTAPNDILELINCYNGTSIVHERYVAAGAVTTERTITLAGGAADDVGTFAHKMVSTALLDKWVLPLDGFWMDVENQAIGSSKTATVEIISSGSLNNDEISLLLEYQGTSGSSLASFGSSMPATVLTAASAITTSTATWNSSPATPVKQQLRVTFTPQLAGRVRGQVRLGKPSSTVYVNPVITIS